MGFIDYEVKGNYAVITINREAALNALNSEVLDELDKTLNGIDIDTIRAVVLTGAGAKSFVAGADIGEMSNLVGISEGIYRSMENGSRSMSWDQYLSLLFLFHYNGRTVNVVDTLGLFPESLKESLKIGG